MAVTVSGMFGNGKTYFADSPVVIDISGLEWSGSSPFNIVRVEVYYGGNKVGDFREDTGGQTTASFDISSALRAIWADYDYNTEVAAADAGNAAPVRAYREYSLIVYTEYLDSTDGKFTTTNSGAISGGRCAIGGLTEWERSTIASKEEADASHLEHTNLRNGDASTKPSDTPERVGCDSITSWVDVSGEGTRSVFYPANTATAEDTTIAHAPIVLRDSQAYADFLFVNRRGAVETCSALTLEAMEIDGETQTYARVNRPSFKTSRSVMSLSSGGRRSWPMSSGYLSREWIEWWALEFLKARRVWMKYKGRYVPVIVESGKKNTIVYDRTKQQMPSVEFTVTMALEG